MVADLDALGVRAQHDLDGREAQALRRRDGERKTSGAGDFAPRVTAYFDRDRGMHVLEARTPSAEVENIWLWLGKAVKVAELSPGAEPVLQIPLPEEMVNTSPCIRAFSFSAKYGAWASADLEVAGRRKDYLVLRERLRPEVCGDVDMATSPRDRM